MEFLLLLTVPVVDPDKDDRNWKRPLNCLQLVISPLVLVLTLQSGVYGIYEISGLLPVWAVVVIVGTALASVTFFATSNSEPPRLHWVRIGSLWWVAWVCFWGNMVNGKVYPAGEWNPKPFACSGFFFF